MAGREGEAWSSQEGFGTPYGLTATDASVCENTGSEEFPVFTPQYKVDLDWTDAADPSKTVAHVEIWRRDVDAGGSFAEIDTTTFAGQNTANSYRDEGQHSNGTPSLGDWEYKVRVQYSDGTHSDYSNTASATTTDPC